MKHLKKFESIQGKIILYFVTLFFIITLVTGLVQYKINTDLQFQGIRDDATQLATAASLLIDGDRHEEIVSIDNETYEQVRTKLQEFMEKTKVSGIYTLAQSDKDTVQFIIDADEDPVELGEEYDYLPEMKTAFGGIPSSDEEMTVDEWGTVLSGYAPVINNQGETVAIVGVDIDASDILQQKRQQIVILTISSLIGLVLMAVVSILISKRISKPIHTVVSAANKIVDGDLDVEIEARSDDEIGILSKAFLEMSGNLKIIIGDIGYLLGEMSNGNFAIQTGHKEKYIGEYQKISEAMTSIIQTLSDTLTEINTASQQVTIGADQVSSAAQALSQGAAEQASSVEELSASIAEVTNQIKQNAENAALARDKAEENGVELMASNAQMKDMMDAMQQISNKASEISNIIKIVDDIAFQTNILALNAAVEAARAGNAGKGFAVVADEVRNLAAKSAEAAKSTAVLIEQTIETVNNGFTIADKAALSLSKSAEVATSAAAVVDSIATASREQAEAIMQINQGIEQIAAVVQTNSATAEESAAASEELSGQAEMLKQLVSRFNLPDSAMKDLIKHHDFEAISTASKSTSLSLTGKY